MLKKRTLALFIALLSVSIVLCGCSGQPTYRVDYGEKKGVFIDAKDRYAEGETVRLKVYLVMDASPTVTADGERLTPEVEGYSYLVYTFTMPAHDVKVTYSLGGSDMMMQPFRISYGKDAPRVIDPVTSAYPGEEVLIKLWIVFDEITEVYVNGMRAEQVNGPDDFLYFTFTMPFGDVEVTIESKNISVDE